ncbi:MAG TPA: DUF4395 domain-containing protein [Chitinophagaceae bacterium]|nr:DUF4395 domain-containing protein [Chitinophagaceae bacterium]
MRLTTTSAANSATANENKIRMVALWVFILAAFSIWKPILPVAIFITADFFLRSFGYGKYSPLAMLSDVVIRTLRIGSKPIYFAPKIFAARIGFLLSLVVLAGIILQLGKVVLFGCFVFVLFAFLESFLGFCAGCYVYYFLTHLKVIRQ